MKKNLSGLQLALFYASKQIQSLKEKLNKKQQSLIAERIKNQTLHQQISILKNRMYQKQLYQKEQIQQIELKRTEITQLMNEIIHNNNNFILRLMRIDKYKFMKQKLRTNYQSKQEQMIEIQNIAEDCLDEIEYRLNDLTTKINKLQQDNFILQNKMKQSKTRQQILVLNVQKLQKQLQQRDIKQKQKSNFQNIGIQYQNQLHHQQNIERKNNQMIVQQKEEKYQQIINGIQQHQNQQQVQQQNIQMIKQQVEEFSDIQKSIIESRLLRSDDI